MVVEALDGCNAGWWLRSLASRIDTIIVLPRLYPTAHGDKQRPRWVWLRFQKLQHRRVALGPQQLRKNNNNNKQTKEIILWRSSSVGRNQLKVATCGWVGACLQSREYLMGFGTFSSARYETPESFTVPPPPPPSNPLVGTCDFESFTP